MNIENMVNDELSARLQELKDEEVTSDKYKAGMDAVLKLMDRKNEMKKTRLESADRQKQIKDEKIDKIVRNSLTGLSIATGVFLTVWGAIQSWEFEKEGTITSTPGRKFINTLFFKK